MACGCVMVRRGASFRRRKRNVQNWEAEHGPDEAPVVYEFKDAWSIRRIVFIRDALREGTLMNHCLDARDWPKEAIVKENAIVHADGWDLLSLRDEQNHPRVTFYIDQERQIQDPHTLGYGRGMTDAGYRDRLERFVADAFGVPLTVRFDKIETAKESRRSPGVQR
jgi:hypothetical protein